VVLDSNAEKAATSFTRWVGRCVKGSWLTHGTLSSPSPLNAHGSIRSQRRCKSTLLKEKGACGAFPSNAQATVLGRAIVTKSIHADFYSKMFKLSTRYFGAGETCDLTVLIFIVLRQITNGILGGGVHQDTFVSSIAAIRGKTGDHSERLN
jgi:hypothetical protein